MCAKTRARHRKLHFTRVWHFTMTRSARRGEKKQALPATPWKEMRSGIGKIDFNVASAARGDFRAKVARAPKSCNSETVAAQWLMLICSCFSNNK